MNTTESPLARPLPEIDDDLLAALAERGFDPRVADGRHEARELALSLLPEDALVSTGGSTTVDEIGLSEALAGSPRVRYGNAAWLREDDPELRLAARKQHSIFADAYIGSVQAITRAGEVLGADAMGSRQSMYVWGPQRVIWIAGANKIVADLQEAFRRVYEVALPLESERIRSLGGDGSSVNKLVIYEREPVPGRTTLILVRESLGY